MLSRYYPGLYGLDKALSNPSWVQELDEIRVALPGMVDDGIELG